MSSTFSTVIHFGMLGLLRRLHRIDIQLRLQAESAQNDIKYTQSKEHKSREKHLFSYSLDSKSDEYIGDAVDRGKQNAVKDIEILGMADVLSLEVESLVEDKNILLIMKIVMKSQNQKY